jgi:redox-regulated HSP33 family molecular chaperone
LGRIRSPSFQGKGILQQIMLMFSQEGEIRAYQVEIVFDDFRTIDENHTREEPLVRGLTGSIRFLIVGDHAIAKCSPHFSTVR